MTGPLLLYSLAELRDVIFPCLDAVGARSVVEVGSEDGLFTAELAAWAEPRRATVYCVEPAPRPELLAVADASPGVVLVRERSPEALEHVEPCDVYLVDGDHNYHTVSRELATVEARHHGRDGGYVVFLHDVGWPSGRRDMYYSPESLPEPAVHRHSYERGTVPGSASLVHGGFRGEGQFAWALDEGGPANGVLTAAEDFLADRSHLRFARVPCVFGLGVIWPESAPWSDALAGALRPYQDSALLGALEQNRLALYLRVLELQDEARAHQAELEGSRLRLDELRVENRALWARVEELESGLATLGQRHDDLRREVAGTLRLRSFALAEQVSSVRKLFGEEPALSRSRLEGLLDDDRADR